MAEIDDDDVGLDSKIKRIIWTAWHKGIGYGMIIAAWINVYLGFKKLKQDYSLEGLSASLIDAAQIVPTVAWFVVVLLEYVIWRANTAAGSSEVAEQENSPLAKSKSGLTNPDRGLSFANRQGANKKHKKKHHQQRPEKKEAAEEPKQQRSFSVHV